MAAALPPPFLDPLFSISLMEDSELRQLVLEILHNIIDRHDNRAKLRGIRYQGRDAFQPCVRRAAALSLGLTLLQDHSERRSFED